MATIRGTKALLEFFHKSRLERQRWEEEILNFDERFLFRTDPFQPVDPNLERTREGPDPECPNPRPGGEPPTETGPASPGK